MQPEAADRWLEAWVLETTGRGLPKDGRYWEAGWDWIAGEREARRPGRMWNGPDSSGGNVPGPPRTGVKSAGS